MGKSSRIKVSRANQKASALGNYKKSEGMPNWAVNLITIVLTLAILLGVLLIALTANGTVLRMRTAVRTENFRVNGQMMTYYANVQYQNFLNNYSSILSSFTLDTEKPLKDQKFNDTTVKENAYDALYLSVPEGFDGTWHDYFMLEAENEVKTMLRYCEAANDLNVALGDTEYKKIDEAIASLEEAATSNGYPLAAYISASFGEGVKEKDIRRAMELSELATLGMNALSDSLMGQIADAEINDAYNANAEQYNQINYSFYSFRVDYADISTEMKAAKADTSDAEILAEYKKQIEDAQRKADELYATANIVEFEKYLLTELATEEYEAQIKKQTLPADGKPSEDQLKLIKDGIIAQAVKELMDGAKAEDAIKKEGEKYVGYSVEMSEGYADVFNKVKTEVSSTLSINHDGYVKDNAEYVDSDEFSTWAFNAERKVDDKKTILNGDKPNDAGEVKRESGYFRADVYRLRSTQYKNTEKTRDLAYMVFATEADAKAAIEALKAEATVDQATFDRIAAEKKATFDVLENYVKGDMGDEEFDEWVFAEDRVVGQYSETPLALSESSFVVLYYTAEGDETWFAAVKDKLFDEKFQVRYEEMEANTEIKVKANVLKKVKIGA